MGSSSFWTISQKAVGQLHKALARFLFTSVIDSSDSVITVSELQVGHFGRSMNYFQRDIRASVCFSQCLEG